MVATASVSGLVSGMDTEEIINKLMDIEKAPIKRLELQQALLKNRIAAWQEANTRVLAVASKAQALSQTTTFDVKSFTSGDESILKGSAGTNAQAGTYYLQVNNLARAHQQASQGFADMNASTVGTGSITITVGSGAPKTITVDSSNNTLAGLRDAINRTGAGVTASIVNDGSAINPYRLVITSETSGMVGEVNISSSLSGGTEPLFTTIQAAQDASITMGEGAGAITITRSTNQITDIIPGVTLNLQKAAPGQTVTVTVAEDTAAVKKAINEFVEQYNNLIDFVNKQFKFNTETNSGGPLFADQNLAMIQADLTAKISSPASVLGEAAKLLSQIGINMTTDNKLAVDEPVLDKILAKGVESVKHLFATVGNTTDPRMIFFSCTDATKVSTSGGYEINITTAAAQARVTAGAMQTESLAADETLTINGKTISLTAGMTPDQVIAAINEATPRTGVVASRTGADGTGTGGYLTLTTTAYGSGAAITIQSNVSNGGGTPLANTSGIGTVSVTQTSYAGETGTGTGAAGIDVAGTINGEPATGLGQMLTGNSGNANTDGLKIRVTGSATGSLGTITLSKGIGASLYEYLNSLTATSTGTVSSQQSFLQEQVSQINKEIATWEERLAARRDRLVIQFARMESALNKFKSQGDYLAGQIAGLSNNWK